MLTGKQIREARALLGLQRSKFAERAGVPHAMLKLAERDDGECPITVTRANQIRRAILRAGIELYGEGEASGARRCGEAATRTSGLGNTGGRSALVHEHRWEDVMTKLPKSGEDVSWETSQGRTHGTVETVVTSTTKVKGHVAKATKDEPQVLVKSDKSGKEAVHRPEELKKG